MSVGVDVVCCCGVPPVMSSFFSKMSQLVLSVCMVVLHES